MKRILSLITVIVLAITLVACGKDDGNYLTVGLEADYPPFNWFETRANDYNHPLYGGGRNDYVAGYDVEVAKFIANELGMDLRIKMISWEALEPSVQAGDIDLIIAGMSPTEERKERIDFTDVYYMSNHVLVVLNDGPFKDVDSIAGLADARGIGQKGTVYADIVDYIGEQNSSVTVLPVSDNVPNIVQMILEGGADFTVVEKPVALGMLAANSNLKIILDTTENIFEVSDEDREIAIGIKKDREDLRTSINNALAKITQTQRDAWMDQAVMRSVDILGD